MKVLYVSYIWPWGVPTGGRIRLGMIAHALSRYADVDLFVVSNKCSPESKPSGYPFQRVGSALLLRKRPSILRRFWRSSAAIAAQGDARDALSEFASNSSYDIVWYGSEVVWQQTSGVVDAKTVIDVDDLNDHAIRHWLGTGQTSEGRPYNFWSKRDARRSISWWRSLHKKAARDSNILVFASESDCSLTGFPRSVTIPNTYPVVPVEHRGMDASRPPMVLLPGSLTYRPNIDAATWLVDEVAPKLRQEIPGIRIVLAGRAGPEVRKLALRPGVEVLGQVPDMAEHILAADVVVVPLRVGGGTRLKIIEAFAHGTPVVSTTIGAEGLQVRADEHLLIADERGAFAAACVDLLNDPAKSRRLADTAHALFLEKYQDEIGHAAVFETLRLLKMLKRRSRTSRLTVNRGDSMA